MQSTEVPVPSLETGDSDALMGRPPPSMPIAIRPPFPPRHPGQSSSARPAAFSALVAQRRPAALSNDQTAAFVSHRRDAYGRSRGPADPDPDPDTTTPLDPTAMPAPKTTLGPPGAMGDGIGPASGQQGWGAQLHMAVRNTILVRRLMPTHGSVLSV